MITRLNKEYTSYLKIKRENGDKMEYSIKPVDESDLSKLNVKIKGPPNSPYENGIFKLYIEVPPKYPFEPPKVSFKTKIIHPNINSNNGYICLDILKDKSEGSKEGWSPVQNIEKVILSVVSLLTDPNANSPLESEYANLYMNKRHEYDELVKKTVASHASNDILDD